MLGSLAKDPEKSKQPLESGAILCPQATFVTRLQPLRLPHKPLVSYRINRQLSGWILPPLMIRAFGAHCH
jgi:hypothetical protein